MNSRNTHMRSARRIILAAGLLTSLVHAMGISEGQKLQLNEQLLVRLEDGKPDGMWLPATFVGMRTSEKLPYIIRYKLLDKTPREVTYKSHHDIRWHRYTPDDIWHKPCPWKICEQCKSYSKTYTLLVVAACRGHFDCVKAIIYLGKEQNGNNKNSASYNIDERDYRGFTAYHMAETRANSIKNAQRRGWKEDVTARKVCMNYLDVIGGATKMEKYIKPCTQTAESVAEYNRETKMNLSPHLWGPYIEGKLMAAKANAEKQKLAEADAAAEVKHRQHLESKLADNSKLDDMIASEKALMARADAERAAEEAREAVAEAAEKAIEKAREEATEKARIAKIAVEDAAPPIKTGDYVRLRVTQEVYDGQLATVTNYDVATRRYEVKVLGKKCYVKRLSMTKCDPPSDKEGTK